jgi:hypothetical protein
VRIGYAKLGRAIHLDPAKYGMQGDPAAPQLIRRLALRNPEHTFVVASKSDGAMEYLPPNCENAWPLDAPRAQWRYLGPGKPLEAIPEGIAYEREVVVPLIGELDGMILDLGQHGTSHSFVPQTPVTWAEAERSFRENGEVHTDKCPCDFTHPHAWARQYGASVVGGMNAMSDRTNGAAPVVILCEDNRNYLKARDLKWPTGCDDILAMHRLERTQVHERFRDPTPAGLTRMPYDLALAITGERGGELWRATHRYRHGGTEMMILPDDWTTWGAPGFEDRVPAGVGTTSFWVPDPLERRSALVRDYLHAAFPGAPVYGKYDKKCLEESGIEPVENDAATFGDLLSQWRVSLALPSIGRMKGGGTWATGKPVQLFAARTAAFFIGPLDSQGWIIPSRRRVHERQVQVAPGLWSVVGEGWTADDLQLAAWLRCETPDEFTQKARIVATDKATWEWIVYTQRALLQRRWDAALLERTIETKLRLR